MTTSERRRTVISFGELSVMNTYDLHLIRTRVMTVRCRHDSVATPRLQARVTARRIVSPRADDNRRIAGYNFASGCSDSGAMRAPKNGVGSLPCGLGR